MNEMPVEMQNSLPENPIDEALLDRPWFTRYDDSIMKD